VPALGYTLSSEEHAPTELVRYARRAEETGFSYALISDHFHPWIDRQGQSPFVWGVLGAIAQATERLQVGTGVTCPTIRLHPAIVAHAAATAGALMPGRFFLGVGTGENLNEHVLGGRWPPGDVRLEMLEEAIEVIRRLWQGGEQTHRGRHYTLEEARLYTLPDEPPPIAVAAAKPQAAELAGRLGDALIAVAPDPDVVERFDAAGGAGKPRYGQVHVCWAESEEEARRTARERWPNAAVPGELSQELPLPRHYEQAAATVTEEEVAEMVVCGPDADAHAAKIQEFADAGFDHVYVHQVGPDQEGFFDFYAREVLPRFG
jgi:coenzyme F420-dependent glucose-6-phosphate dehydrogenase